MLNRSKFPVFIALSGWLLTAAASAENCPELSVQHAAEQSQKIQPWSIGARDLKLTAGQILPADYLMKVTEIYQESPKVKVTYAPFGDRVKALVEVEVYGQTFIKVSLRNGQNSGELALDDLRLEDVLSIEAKKLHASQQAKGMPIAVFGHLRRRLQEIAMAGGFSSMVSSSQQNFGVVTLYRRMVGMEAANAETQKRLEFLDDLYDFARKGLPPEVRASSLDDFSRMLGAVDASPAALLGERQPSGLYRTNYVRTSACPSSEKWTARIL